MMGCIVCGFSMLLLYDIGLYRGLSTQEQVPEHRTNTPASTC